MPPPLRSLDLPPPFRLLVLREVGDAFAHACAHTPGLGAGTLVFVGGFDFAEFAIVLEPEEELWSSRRSFYAGMTAIADALSALAPPETPITIEWPDWLEVGATSSVTVFSGESLWEAEPESAVEVFSLYARVKAKKVGSDRTTGSGSVGATSQFGAMFGVGRCGGSEKTSLISLTSEERRTRAAHGAKDRVIGA